MGEILSGFRYHALCRTVSLKVVDYIWDHDLCYSTFDRGHVIYRTGNAPGLAVLREEISDEKVGVYEWEFVLEDCHFDAEHGLSRSCTSDPPWFSLPAVCSKSCQIKNSLT
jgi:hypothetical protein